MSDQNKNYYDVLDIPEDSDPDEIHKGYLRTRNAYSQDGVVLYGLIGQEGCKEALELIEEAYGILSHPRKRMAYDKARGLNKNLKTKYSYTGVQYGELHTGSSIEENSPNINSAQTSTSENSITKIMAHERFGLEFEPDAQFEKEIEGITEWTGAWLKKVREYKCVSIPRLADMTKISKIYLRAIEQEDFETLPPTAYIRGFVYQYSKCLKLNPDLICSSYLYRVKKAKGE